MIKNAGVFVLSGWVLLNAPAHARPWVNPALPEIPTNQFVVTDYGANPVSRAPAMTAIPAPATAGIQAAINAASAAGGGTVEVPAGTFLCGPLRMASGINLHVDGTLRMLPLGQYPGGTDNPDDFISGEGLHDIAISGPGTIDGQGSPWWPYAKQKGARRPRMIKFTSCERVLIENVRLLNSPMFHIAISGKTTDVTVRGVTIRANPSDDPVNPGHNTDACDVSGKHILIQDCDVSVGDDDYTCGGGTSEVLITNCVYGHGHGLSIGSPTSGGVSDITVDHCTFTGTEQGIRIKTDRDRGGFVHDLCYLNLCMTNVGCPILVYCSYNATGIFRSLNNVTPSIAGRYPARPVGRRTPIFRDLVFSNITATVQSGRRAGLIWGLPEMAITNVLLQQVNITADKPFGVFEAKHVRLVDSHIRTPEGVNRLATERAQVTVATP